MQAKANPGGMIVRNAILALALLSAPAQADDFYAGRQVSIVVGNEPGTGFDLYARSLARFMGEHIPGKPSLVVQNMVGASGLVAFNWLANVAPKDGSALLTAPFTVPFEPLFGNASARFDASRLNWIGNMDASVSICGVSKASGVGGVEDAMRKEVLVGATGATGPMSQSTAALNQLLGTQFKRIEGYKGSAAVKLAVERGEVSGVCGISLSTVRTQWRELHESGALRLILQLGPSPHPDLPDVAHVYSFAKSNEDRQVFDLIFGVQGLGRSFVAPGGTPAARVATLRRAFDDTMKDASFRAYAAKTGVDLAPQSGDDVQAFIERVYRTPQSVIDRARRVTER
jgi:tripartite-type tricarboxylate transporter receptor subunit TctC